MVTLALESLPGVAWRQERRDQGMSRCAIYHGGTHWPLQPDARWIGPSYMLTACLACCTAYLTECNGLTLEAVGD